MKKILLIAALLIVLSVVVFAQQTCPDLTPQITDCQKQGLDPKYDQSNNCKQVIGCCSNDYVAQDLACRTKGGGSVLGVDSNSCTFLRECKMPTVCKTEEEISKEKESCENSKGNFQKWPISDGCYETSCMAAPSCDWTEKEKDRCKTNGGSPREVKQNYAYGGPTCPMIVCDYPSPSSYSSKQECESSTNCFCEYKDCNYVMKGTSYEDTCGKNFSPGWYCQIPKPSDGIIKCGGSAGWYCPRGYRCDSQDGNKEGKCVKDENQQTSCYVWREEEINQQKQRCDQSGGKLEKRENFWSGAENCYDYRCISQDGKCGSGNGMGMLECPQGSYCEQPDNRNNYGPNYQQEYGKCVSINKQEKCPVLDAKEKEKCALSGGTPDVKKNEKGCEYYECKQNKDFCGGIAGIQCIPGYKCELDGNYPDAGGKCVPEKKCPPQDEKEIAAQKNKCVFEYKGEFKIKTDTNGCTYTDCVFTSSEPKECMLKEEVQAQLNKCVSNNGSPKIKSEQGCVKEVACLIEEKPKDLPPEEKKDYDLGRLFNVAFKLEELRIQFDKLKKKTQNIADYYETQSEQEYANKFKVVSGLFDNALNEVDNIKSDLRENIDKDLTNEESMGKTKNSIQKLKDSMKDILKELLR